MNYNERLAAEVEKQNAHDLYIDHIANTFSKREAALIRNCIAYIGSDPAGLPGHNLMILVYKLANYANLTPENIYSAHDQILIPIITDDNSENMNIPCSEQKE